MTPARPLRVAIVGAGWAGLACALTLHRAGHHPTVFEAAPTPGGRARRIHTPQWRLILGSDTSPSNAWEIAQNTRCSETCLTPDFQLDNGQHLLLGAYERTLATMHALGLDTQAAFHREPLRLESLDGSFRIAASGALPAPWHLASGMLRARGMGWAERLRLARWLGRALSEPESRMAPGLTVAHWLAPSRPGHALWRDFWAPLCIAAMNTPPEQACARLFRRVLADSLGSDNARATDLLIPRSDLSALWPDAAMRALGTDEHGRPRVRLREPVRNLEIRCQSQLRAGSELTQSRVRAVSESALSSVRVNSDTGFEALVVAGQVPATRRLLEQLPQVAGSEVLLAQLDAFRFLPIATLNVWLTRPWEGGPAMRLLREDATRGHLGQWLFNRYAYQAAHPKDTNDAACQLHVVISHATQLPPGEALAHAVLEQIREQLPPSLPPLPEAKAWCVVTEKRATFAAVPGLQRPSNTTPWPNVFLAGDWTDTGYPAVLEGAIRSGESAARQLMQRLSPASAPQDTPPP